jgi:hypothetical protein
MARTAQLGPRDGLDLSVRKKGLEPSRPCGASPSRLFRNVLPVSVDTATQPGTIDVPGLLSPSRLRLLDVLGARALRALSHSKGHLFALAQRVERRPDAGGLVKEVFGPVRCSDEAETLVGDALDGAGSRRHACISLRWPVRALGDAVILSYIRRTQR